MLIIDESHLKKVRVTNKYVCFETDFEGHEGCIIISSLPILAMDLTKKVLEK